MKRIPGKPKGEYRFISASAFKYKNTWKPPDLTFLSLRNGSREKLKNQYRQWGVVLFYITQFKLIRAVHLLQEYKSLQIAEQKVYVIGRVSFSRSYINMGKFSNNAKVLYELII